MNSLSSLSKSVTKSRKRVGRGYGSGVGGHTTTKGAKGKKIRTKTKLTFDGTKIKKSWLKRLPFLRGKRRINSFQTRPLTVSLSFLDKNLKTGDKLDFKILAKLLKTELSYLQKTGVKILSSTKVISKTFSVDKQIQMSKSVKDKIIATGGKII